VVVGTLGDVEGELAETVDNEVVLVAVLDGSLDGSLETGAVLEVVEDSLDVSGTS
jgi:hypothetical protein